MSGALNAIPKRAILQVIISQTTNVSMIECLWNRSFPRSSSASISGQVYAINMHTKNFALRVALKERLKGTQKWSITIILITQYHLSNSFWWVILIFSAVVSYHKLKGSRDLGELKAIGFQKFNLVP